MIKSAPSLTDQVYDAIVDEICDGQLAPGAHLVQERLAERYEISRQPIQQAMARLKADGMVEELGRRGLFVAPLNPKRMRDHYDVRAALDGWSARKAAERVKSDAEFAARFAAEGRRIVDAGFDAVAKGDIAAQVRCDSAFHFFLYDATGNSMFASSAEPHWRFLRRAMGAVLRDVETPKEIWTQHQDILEAIVVGEHEKAERLAIDHDLNAADSLAKKIIQDDNCEAAE